MLQISDMDGAVLLTFSEPLSLSEKKLLNEAKKVDTENARFSDSPVGAGGIRWGACAKNKAVPAQQAVTPQVTQTAVSTTEQEINEMNKAIQAAQTDEEIEQVFEAFGYETLYDPDDDGGIPF